MKPVAAGHRPGGLPAKVAIFGRPLYHGTSLRNWAKIREEGLKPGPHGIWCSPNLGMVGIYTTGYFENPYFTGGGVVIEITGVEAEETFLGMPGSYLIQETVPPSQLRLLPNKTWQDAIGWSKEQLDDALKPKVKPPWEASLRTASEDWGSHRPQEGESLHDLTGLFGEAVYEHPEHYVFANTEPFERESIAVVKRVRNQPNARVRIYRAVPPEHMNSPIRTGDWVAIAEGYARQHAIQSDDPREDWPVVSAEVAAKDVHNGGNDLIEWGYFGPSVQPRLEPKQASLATEAADSADTDGVMIALVAPKDVNEILHGLEQATEPVENAHLTLLYLGSKADAGGAIGRERIYRGVYDFAIHSGYRGLTGKPNGFGVFCNDDANVLWVAWDIPGIAEFRTHLQEALRRHGVKLRQDDHGFTPHQTLTYSDDPITEIPRLPDGLPDKVIFPAVVISWGDEWQEVPLA